MKITTNFSELLRRKESSGRTFAQYDRRRDLSGKDAFEHKLIDGLGQLDDAFGKAKELGNAPDAKV